MAAFRQVGKGHSAIETVDMNICPPMNINAYKKTGELYESYKKATQGNMKDATREVRKEKLKENFSEEQVVDMDASFDGTWQNGVVTVISRDSGMCIDLRILSKNAVCVMHDKIRKGLQRMIVLLQIIMVNVL